MGMECKVCLEALIEGRWTHLTCFSLEHDNTLFERLGYEPNTQPSDVAPQDWSAVSRWLFPAGDGHHPITVSLATIRELGEQRWRERPQLFDARPGWIPPFQEWLE